MKPAITVEFDGPSRNLAAARNGTDEAEHHKRTQRLLRVWPPPKPEPTRHRPTPASRPGPPAAVVRRAHRPVAVVPHD